MRIVITGPKGSGKSTIGGRLAALLELPFIETDSVLENLYYSEKGTMRTCREIFRSEGEKSFREWEARAVEELADMDWCIIATGGGTMMNPGSRSRLLARSIAVLLKAPVHMLWDRIQRDGVPPFLNCNDGLREYQNRIERLDEVMEPRSDIIFSVTEDNQENAHLFLKDQIEGFLLIKMHSPSTFGEIVRVTTFGESHGPAVGAVVDGLPPMIPISEEDIQLQLDRRRPGQSEVTTPRNETDRVKILSGVFEGKTTGSPLCMVIYNRDQDSSRYEDIRDIFRPGHADFTFWKKFGIRDHRGGGRSSGRETASRVASGAIARKMLGEMGVEVISYAEEIAGVKGEVQEFSEIERNSVRSADPDKAGEMEEAILKARGENDSVGGIVRLIIRNLPAGLGDPVFFKLDARLSMALFSIGAVKGVEIGSGFGAARLRGSQNNDQMQDGKFLTNNAGGILGGISTGEDIVVRIAVKPTPSIAREQKTINISGDDVMVAVEGRHDPCIVPRIVPVVEAMASLVILDAMEIQKRLGR